MSYDLAVYAPRAASHEELDGLVGQGAGLQVESETDQHLTIVRGVRRRYSFTVDGPDSVEPEDVPEDVTAVLLGARWLYSVTAEGTTESEIPHARRFARRLAQALDGAVVDQQTDEVWSRSRSRTVQKPARRERVATVDVAWYCLRDELKGDPSALFLNVAQRVFPEALPRRFGEYEPLQGKLAEVGFDGFTGAWADSTSVLFTAGSGPCTDGHLSAGPCARFADRFWSMKLTFLADPIHQSGWRAALRTLFTTLADGFPAFYASAEVTTGHIWSGRSLWADGDTERSINPLRHGNDWTGLPPRPTWWSWLGTPFSEHYPSLPTEQTAATANGVLHEAAEEPSTADDFVPLNRWLPADLFATFAPNPHRQQPVPLVKAKTMPANLGPPLT